MKFPNLPRKGKSIEDDVKDIINYLRSSRVVNIVGGRLLRSPNGTTIEVLPGKSKAGATATGTCHFGEIITVPDSDPEKKAIRGGVIYCGDKNFHVDAQELTLTSDIERMVQIKITGVTANTDDDGELILPGVETATGTPEWENKTGTAYDDNTNPTATTPGTVIIPIGKLVIADGAATLDATGCGNIRVSQCAGTLTVDRP